MPATILGPIEDVGVLGCGTAFPPVQLDNAAALAHTPGAERRSPEQLAFAAKALGDSLGLRSRAWAHPVGSALEHDSELTTIDLMIDAGRTALLDAGVAAADLAMVLCATSTPPRMTSTLSAPVGAALGTTGACMDTRAGCSAGVFALATGALHVAAGAGPVLILGGETFSKVIPPSHKMAVMALGDGAGALVLGAKPGAAVLGLSLQSDGGLGSLIGTAGRLPPTAEEIDGGGFQLSGQPDALAKALPARYLSALANALGRAGLSGADLDLYTPHQTSVPLIRGVAEQAGVRAERVWTEGVARHANIGAAGWMVALAEARAEGRCEAGDLLGVASVGGGMSWAAAVLRL